MHKLKIPANDGLKLSLAVFQAEETKGLVQMIHGAKEHKERYYDFIEFLNSRGLTVIISDTRGHGESTNEEYPLGYMGDIDLVVQDQVVVTRYIRNLYPDQELYMFGHSLGSLIARLYLQKHDEQIKKLVLCGTVYYNPFVGIAIGLGKVVSLFQGKREHNHFLDFLSTGGQKDDSWISVNQENLNSYRNDPLCQFVYANHSVLTVFRADRQLHQYQNYVCKNPDLQIFSISGADDPITGGTKGLNDSIQSLRKMGYKNVLKQVYPGMRHEILNEKDKKNVYQDIVGFFLPQ